MKYSKREVRDLLDNKTHVLKIEFSEEFAELVKELYPKDKWLEKNTIKQVEGCYLITSGTCIDEWYWSDFETERTVILFSDIEREEVILKYNEIQFLSSNGNWKDLPGHYSTQYRLKPKKHLELERLAEELGYNLIKK